MHTRRIPISLIRNFMKHIYIHIYSLLSPGFVMWHHKQHMQGPWCLLGLEICSSQRNWWRFSMQDGKCLTSCSCCSCAQLCLGSYHGHVDDLNHGSPVRRAVHASVVHLCIAFQQAACHFSPSNADLVNLS